ncbi:MAG: hypothetical protein JY451_02610 [Erythrobacter sp.]|nr:MAG: hypothetical protein JY451_02610 [Erythrobacter sp.]
MAVGVGAGVGREVARLVGVGAGVGRVVGRAVGRVVGTGRGSTVGAGRGRTGGAVIGSGSDGCGKSVTTGAKLAAGSAEGSGAVLSRLTSVARLTSIRSGGTIGSISRVACHISAAASATCATTAAPMPIRSSGERRARVAIVSGLWRFV